MAAKKRISYDEFIEEKMAQYSNEKPLKLMAIIRDLLEGVWDRDTVELNLVEQGRELVEVAVGERPLKCRSCSETLHTLIQITNEATVYRISKDGGTLFLKEDARLKELEKLVERKCPHCSENLDLSGYNVEMVD